MKILGTYDSQEEFDEFLIKEIERIKNKYRDDFHFKLEFVNTTFNSSINFDIISTLINYSFVFHDTTFNKNVEFNNLNIKFKFNLFECTFKENDVFTNCNFNNFLYFKPSDEVEIEKIYDSNITFKYCTFDNLIEFRKTVFRNGITFHDSEFNDKVNAWEVKAGGNVDFQWSNFNKRVNLSTLKEIEGTKLKVNFYGAKFEERLYLYDLTSSSINLDRIVHDKSIYLLGSAINSMNRETARIIKNEFIQQNNKIESLKYYSIEMHGYRDELKKEPKKLSDKLILNLNYISNNFNSSPIRAFIFTIIVSIFFFSVYLMSLENYQSTINCTSDTFEAFNSSGRILGDFLSFINPIRKPGAFIDIKDIDLGNWSTAIDAIAKIFIGYGYYQFIQAFRKFSKQ